MKFSEEASLRERIHQLIRLKATGTPDQLAKRLNMSKRNLFRTINEMREDGFPIAYDRIQERYYYEKEVIFEVKFYVAEKVELQKVAGGKLLKIFDNFFSAVPDFGIEEGFLCSR